MKSSNIACLILILGLELKLSNRVLFSTSKDWFYFNGPWRVSDQPLWTGLVFVSHKNKRDNSPTEHAWKIPKPTYYINFSCRGADSDEKYLSFPVSCQTWSCLTDIFCQKSWVVQNWTCPFIAFLRRNLLKNSLEIPKFLTFPKNQPFFLSFQGGGGGGGFPESFRICTGLMAVWPIDF